MGRFKRIVIPGIAHHITHRGNNQKNIFFNPDDRDRYFTLLKHYSDKHDFRILAYCLMTNHVHIVGIPEKQESLPRVIRDTHQRYSLTLNQRLKRSGHVWQNRYFSCPLDESHLVATLCYTEQNPTRAGMVEYTWEYPWSSARVHLGLMADKSEVLDMSWWNSKFDPEGWRETLGESVDDKSIDDIRYKTKSGLPLGKKAFRVQLEKRLGRELSKKPRGRNKIGTN